MANEWQVKIGNRIHGPFTDEQLHQLVRSGRVDVDTPIRPAANKVWKRAGETEGLFGAVDPSAAEHAAAVEEIVDEVLLGTQPKQSTVRQGQSQGTALATTAAAGTKACPFCAELIQSAAIKCKHCGEFLDGRKSAVTHRPEPVRVVQIAPPAPAWSPGAAAVLSFLFPGLGQMYKGQIGMGLLLLVITVIGYMALILPGLAIHIFTIFDAYSGNPHSGSARR
ncbi:GYF domain-containing protein [Planctellipticum variicoloris]|uniref:GYF domain-containing protein n=1 Tax=Planctellipticum variicoloris TaxID=3064265 RepID=UPI00301365A6|nr:DUF4339 domain-containing protein [Planctomycetaceae bacterium SH412]